MPRFGGRIYHAEGKACAKVLGQAHTWHVGETMKGPHVAGGEEREEVMAGRGQGRSYRVLWENLGFYPRAVGAQEGGLWIEERQDPIRMLTCTLWWLLLRGWTGCGVPGQRHCTGGGRT